MKELVGLERAATRAAKDAAKAAQTASVPIRLAGPSVPAGAPAAVTSGDIDPRPAAMEPAIVQRLTDMVTNMDQRLTAVETLLKPTRRRHSVPTFRDWFVTSLLCFLFLFLTGVAECRGCPRVERVSGETFGRLGGWN
jgi:hypothetical protein